ncbi:hypothetical protein HYW94_00870 [Candidatus Uhrbacteria bacterium]|nr:hypothetical protein [Candidatus Uhrbacteria bacterium]
MYQTLLTQLGLAEKEATIYETLVEKGSLTAGRLLKELPYKRGDMYYLLSRLKEKGLVTDVLSKKGVAVFTAANPTTLESLAEKVLEKAQQIKTGLDAALPNLKSLYNLAMEKPGMRFYEGEAGIWKLLNDTLDSKTELLFLGDHDAINTHIPTLNKDYVLKRKKRHIKKRLIQFDTPSARAFARTGDEFTEVRLIATDASNIRSFMHIYDNKVSYVTFLETAFIGVLIEDPMFYQLQRVMFEYMWKTATRFTNS